MGWIAKIGGFFLSRKIVYIMYAAFIATVGSYILNAQRNSSNLEKLEVKYTQVQKQLEDRRVNFESLNDAYKKEVEFIRRQAEQRKAHEAETQEKLKDEDYKIWYNTVRPNPSSRVQ